MSRVQLILRAAYVPSASGFQNINQVIDGGVAANGDVGGIDLVLAHDGLDFAVVNVRQGNSVGNVEAALVLLLEGDVGRRLVDADTESFQFGLDDALVRQRLVDVEDDEDQVARLCDGNDLATSTATVLGTLDDTGQIDDL